MKRILMIEDDLELCEILQFYLLKEADYDVTVVHNAESALKLVISYSVGERDSSCPFL